MSRPPAPGEQTPARPIARSVVRAAVVSVLVALAPALAARAGDALPYDRGAVGTWQAPARGSQVGLLTLNRGEGGDNALAADFDGWVESTFARPR